MPSRKKKTISKITWTHLSINTQTSNIKTHIFLNIKVKLHDVTLKFKQRHFQTLCIRNYSFTLVYTIMKSISVKQILTKNTINCVHHKSQENFTSSQKHALKIVWYSLCTGYKHRNNQKDSYVNNIAIYTGNEHILLNHL